MRPRFAELNLSLFRRGINVRLAEAALLADEDYIHLAQCVIERAIEETADIIGHETKHLHPGHDIEELRSSDHPSEQRYFENDGLGLLEGLPSPRENLKLGPLDIDFYEVGPLEVFLRTDLVDCDDGDGSGRAIDSGPFDFFQKARTDFVWMDVEKGGAGYFARRGEDILGVVAAAEIAERRLELDKGLDEKKVGGRKLLVKLGSLIGDADVNHCVWRKTEAGELLECTGHAGARRGGGLLATNFEVDVVEDLSNEVFRCGEHVFKPGRQQLPPYAERSRGRRRGRLEQRMRRRAESDRGAGCDL